MDVVCKVGVEMSAGIDVERVSIVVNVVERDIDIVGIDKVMIELSLKVVRVGVVVIRMGIVVIRAGIVIVGADIVVFGVETKRRSRLVQIFQLKRNKPQYREVFC